MNTSAQSRSELKMTARGPLVLLFYDGFELKALPGAVGAFKSQLHRFLRYTKRSLCSQQVHTGFYTAFLAMKHCLEQAGCNVRVNDFATARKNPHYPIGVGGYPSILDCVETLPNPRIFGPGDWGLPGAGSTRVAQDARYKKLIQPSDWFADMYRPSCGDKMCTWFAGINTDRWPDFSAEPKNLDFVVYDKIRWHRDERVPRILDRILAHLEKTGRTYQVLRYGHHHHSEFRATLKRARAMIFVCEHETQGLACQEALATGTPVLTWDEGEMVDPTLKPFVTPGLPISSVPYFSDGCGMRFKVGEFEPVCDAFWQKIGHYAPRRYVQEHLSLALSARLYLHLYSSLLDKIK